jgi:hypothetical protein
MPFTNAVRPYTKVNIESLKDGQNGVYGIFKGTACIYVGKGDFRTRLLAHINGDNSCIQNSSPNSWTAEVITGDPSNREKELILEYRPTCNQRLG